MPPHAPSLLPLHTSGRRRVCLATATAVALAGLVLLLDRLLTEYLARCHEPRRIVSVTVAIYWEKQMQRIGHGE